MFEITVRRTQTTYTIKPPKGAIVTLPRPLTEDSGLDVALIEKITTCKKHETRTLTQQEGFQLQKFAPAPIVAPEPEAYTPSFPAPALTIEMMCAKHDQTLRVIGASALIKSDGPWGVFEPVWASFVCPRAEKADSCAATWHVNVVTQ